MSGMPFSWGKLVYSEETPIVARRVSRSTREISEFVHKVSGITAKALCLLCEGLEGLLINW